MEISYRYILEMGSQSVAGECKRDAQLAGQSMGVNNNTMGGKRELYLDPVMKKKKFGAR